MNTLLISALVSQGLFARVFEFAGVDGAYSITQTTEGGYAVVGYSDPDYILAFKLDRAGNLSYSRLLGGYARSVAPSADGGFVTAGTWIYIDLFECLFLKMDAFGNLSWAITYGDGTHLSDESASSIVQTADGGFVATGWTRSSGAGLYDLLVLKLSSSGGLQWTKTFGGTGGDWAYSIAQTTDGGFVAAGWTNSFGAGSYDFLVLKLSSSGDLQWAKTFGGTGMDGSYAIAQTADGGYAVVGFTESFGVGYDDFLVLKLEPSGNLSWAKTVGSNNEICLARSVAPTPDGGCVVAGEGMYNILVCKFDATGNLDWANKLLEECVSRAYHIIRDTDGSFVMVGETECVSQHPDPMVLRLNPDGSYPDCVGASNLTVTTPTIYTSSIITGLASWSPIRSYYGFPASTPSIVPVELCLPIEAEETDPICSRPRIISSPFPGSILFLSSDVMGIKIYSPDGRLAYSGDLKKGQNRISLDQGVYLWQAGPYKGKAVVR